MTAQDRNQHPTQAQPKGNADFRAVVDDVENRNGRDGEVDRVVPEQPGCGPNVTDYPGMPSPTGEDAQSTGSDA